MRRVGPRDKLLLAVLLPIWLVFFGLCLRSVLYPPRFPAVAVRADEAGGPPVLIAIAPWVDRGGSDLQVGDRLVQINEVDLRGMGPVGFGSHFVAEAAYGRPPPRVIYERDGRRGETTVPVPDATPLAMSLAMALVSFSFAFAGVFLALRAPPSPLVRWVSRGLLLWALTGVCFFYGGVALNYAILAAIAVIWSLAYPLCLRALLVFLRGERPASTWDRLGPWLFAVMGPVQVSQMVGFPLRHQIAFPLATVLTIAYSATILVLVLRAYRAAYAVRRRQIRWIVLGFYGAVGPQTLVFSLVFIDGLLGGSRGFGALLLPSFCFGILLPLSILVAIVRFNLFDVDRLLSAAASYNIVLVALVGAGLVIVPFLGELSSSLLGVDPRVGQVALSLALAAVVVPLHQRLRPRIDRAFFKERHALDHGIADLLRSLSACENARALTRRVGEELHRLLRPEACVVYAGGGESFAPIFVEGRGVPPAFAAGSPLVATLRERHKPLALSATGRKPDAADLGPFDRAALAALEAEVVVPVRRDETLLAFLCLGPKRSGDVYTSTDLSHLASVAEAVSSQLRRFDQEEVIREGQAMQESLRRYVPGAVAEQLASGAELAPAEREVSVLFVDLRGYTRFAEARRAEEIFSTVNRYTEAVSQIVRRHGGSVVEFNGDGMMAVFGAPRELPDKETAAVAAGREIIGAVGALPVEPARGGEEKLTVGVGIATGEAFVGSIRAADRMIWSAIGNPTNLASRLQGLSRELQAELVIDAATWEALGETRRDFVAHHAIAIRGRGQAQDLYALRRAPPTSFRQ